MARAAGTALAATRPGSTPAIALSSSHNAPSDSDFFVYSPRHPGHTKTSSPAGPAVRDFGPKGSFALTCLASSLILLPWASSSPPWMDRYRRTLLACFLLWGKQRETRPAPLSPCRSGRPAAAAPAPYLVVRQPLGLGDEQRAAHLALRLGEDVPVLPDQTGHCGGGQPGVSGAAPHLPTPPPQPPAPHPPPRPAAPGSSPASLPTGSPAASPLLPAPSAMAASPAPPPPLSREPPARPPAS